MLGCVRVWVAFKVYGQGWAQAIFMVGVKDWVKIEGYGLV